ncbi:MAG: Bax inhibitor-1/YccA family protein [Bacteroidaceae bacterium]|nr:Bax inhibitor-1/YccA family protein [Bacteroidaceae bacterium]
MGYERNYRDTTYEVAERMTMNRVYGWMALALVVSALSAVFTAGSPAMLRFVFGSRFTFFGLIIAELGLVWYLSSRIMTLKFATAAALMGLYSVLNGVVLSSVLLVYAEATVQAAFLATGVTFAVMSAIGYFTKTDLTRMGSILLMALVGVIVATVVNLFLRSDGLTTVITYVGLLIFIGLTAYDTQKIKQTLAVQEEYGMHVDVRKIALMGALNLYLDFINMFLYILRLMDRD